MSRLAVRAPLEKKKVTAQGAATGLLGSLPAAPVEDQTDAVPGVEVLFTRYAGYVAGIGHRILARRGDVDDLVQEVFLQVHKDLGQLRDPTAVRGWLAMITVRTAHRMLRVQRVKSMLGFDDAPDYLDVAAPSANPEQRETLAAIYRQLDKMPPRFRVPWVLRRFEERPVEQIAQLCGCSLATAKRRIARADSMLEEVTNE
ncbi:MAG TPA: sigma-70 family RNA polymerase sigma factor [Polyangiaceae bacterium]|jgi:RNA polymerase sigma-70 factor (ECF subfamily)